MARNHIGDSVFNGFICNNGMQENGGCVTLVLFQCLIATGEHDIA